MLDAEPDVFAHNLETVRRSRRACATSARATTSRLRVSRTQSARAPQRYTKTSLMLGLGETEAEIEAAMDDARAAGVDIFTMGQYLQPTKKHLPVVEFVTPEKFERLGTAGAQQRLPSGRLEPALAQLVSRRTSLLNHIHPVRYSERPSRRQVTVSAC